MASNPTELEYWVEIIKHIMDNQLAIVYQLTELKPNAAKLKHWVEIIGGQSVDTSWQR